MKTFDKLYSELQDDENSELNDLLKKVQQESKKTWKKVLIICLIVDILILLVCLNIDTLDLPRGIMILQTIGVMLFVDAIIMVILNAIFSGNYGNYRKYVQKYKSVVIDKLISNFYNSAEYFPTKELPRYMYDEGKYEEYYNRYWSEDYIEAEIDNKYSIQMGEVLTEDESGDSTSICFTGLFAKVIMHKSMQGELRIMRNGTFAFSNKLKMDSSEFEKCFDVKASDNIKGMQLLTADVMEELMDFVNNTQMIFDIVIRNNYLYLRFHSGSMFEPRNIKGDSLNKEEIQKYFYMLNFTYNLSKRLISLIEETEM